jgi:protein SCO1/2
VELADRSAPRWALAVACMIAASACRETRKEGEAPNAASAAVSASAAPLDVRLPVPTFKLVDQRGRPFDSTSMRGKVWVVDFIFTSCPKICPDLTHKMAGLVSATESEPDVRFLSISVDPENDTPDELARFVEKHGRATERWALVTGDPKVVSETVLGGFKVAMGKDSAGNLFHGEHFVVVDKEGFVRGFFQADDEGLAALLARVRQLAH